MKAKLYKIFSVLAVFFFCLTTFTAGAANLKSGLTIYYDATDFGDFSGKKLQIMVGKSGYSINYELKKVGCNLYSVNIGDVNGGSDWKGATQIGFMAATEVWGGENSTPSSRIKYAGEGFFTGIYSFYSDLSGKVLFKGKSTLSITDNNYTPPTEYYITGNGTASNSWCNGVAWDPSACANKLENGQISFNKLPAGDYEFKITNGTWDKVYGYNSNFDANNSTKSDRISYTNTNDDNIKISTKDCADITVKFNPSATKKVSVEATLYPTKYYLTGIEGNNKIEMFLEGSEYVLKNQPIKSTDVVKVLVESECGDVEYKTLDGSSCSTVKSTADGITFKKDGSYDFYFKSDNSIYVGVAPSEQIKYLLMGVNTDWENGIELVKNPDNGSEWMALGVEINAERDAIQIVTKDLCAEYDGFCHNVKYSSTVPYYVKDNNIILETGTYDFYFKPTENKVHIEGEVKKAVTVYLDINGKDWNNGRVALYFYKDGGVDRWVSAKACEDNSNIYYAEIPRGFDTYIWVKLQKDTDNSWGNKQDQTENITLNSLQNLATLTNSKDGEGKIKVTLSEYTGYCKQEFPIQVELPNEPVQDGSAWKLDARYEGTAVIEEFGFFINRATTKGGAFVTENINAGKVSAEISAENEKIFEGKASYNLLPGYWHGYRAYVKVNGEYSLSTTTKWFYVENTCKEYKYETQEGSVLVHINSNVDADPCNFVFNSFEQAFAVLKSVEDICEVTTERIGTVDQDVIKLKQPVIMLVHFAAEPYRGSEEVGMSGGHIYDAPAIFFRNINKNGEGKPLIVRTADPKGNRAVIVHPVIRRSTNIVLDNLDIISDPNLRDNAIDIDTGIGMGNLEGLDEDYNIVQYSIINHNITLKNSKYISYGRNCIHVVGINGIHIENNEFYTRYDFSVNRSEGDDVVDWGGTIKFINTENVKFLRNNSEGTLATSFFIQGCRKVLLMNNVFWNDNAVSVPNLSTAGRTVANVRLVNYGAQADEFPIKNIGIYYNTFFIKNNDLGAGSYHKFDFFRLGGFRQPVMENNAGNKYFDPTTIRFQYNNCYSYDEDITGNNDENNETTFYLQGIGKSTDWCQCFVYNNFWSKYDEANRKTSSSFELGKYCTGVNESYNLYTSVDDQVCKTDPQQPGALVVKGDKWNIGTVITEKEDVSEQGAHLIFNDRLNPDNGVNSIRPQMSVDNSNEALSPYDHIYLEPGTINLFTSPIVGSQTTDVMITSIKLTPKSNVNLSIVDKNDVLLYDKSLSKATLDNSRFKLTNAVGESIFDLTTDENGSLDNAPVYVTFYRPTEAEAETNQIYEVFLRVVPSESADAQLILRIPIRGHHKSDIETIGGAWTVGAFQQREAVPVDTIIWHGLTSAEWDDRNNWYKTDGTLVTCLDDLTENLTVIIPRKDSEKYMTPAEGVQQYPTLPNIASKVDFDARDEKWHGEQVNAGNSGKVADKILMEYGAALVGVEELANEKVANRYTEVEQEFIARRHDWLLVGTVVKPWDRDEEGNIKTEEGYKLTRNVVSGDYYLNYFPHVYMHEAYITEIDDKITADWANSFASLNEEVPEDKAFAISIPDQYGLGVEVIPGLKMDKLPAEVYNSFFPGSAYDGNAPHTYKFTGRFHNDYELPTYSGLTPGEPVLLTNTYPANIDAKKLQDGKGSVQYYDYEEKSFIPLGDKTGKSIMSQHGFVFTPKEGLTTLKVDSAYFQNTETGHRSAVAGNQSFRVKLINRADKTASEIYIRYDEYKDDVINYAMDAPKVFNGNEESLGDLYVKRYGKKWAGLVIPTMSEPIPLGIEVNSSDKAFTFTLEETNIDADIILEDRFTGEQYNLSKGENYRVEGLVAGKSEARFYLLLAGNEEELPEEGEDVTTEVEDTESLASGIDIFTQENSVVVSCSSDSELMQVVVSDVAGRHQVYKVSGQYVKLDLPVNTGVYTISVIGDKATRVEKIKLN